MDCFDDYQKHYTNVIDALERECRDWVQAETNEAFEAIIAVINNPRDAVVFIDGLVNSSSKLQKKT